MLNEVNTQVHRVELASKIAVKLGFAESGQAKCAYISLQHLYSKLKWRVFSTRAVDVPFYVHYKFHDVIYSLLLTAPPLPLEKQSADIVELSILFWCDARKPQVTLCAFAYYLCKLFVCVDVGSS